MRDRNGLGPIRGGRRRVAMPSRDALKLSFGTTGVLGPGRGRGGGGPARGVRHPRRPRPLNARQTVPGDPIVTEG
jgi:hypothetical protein